MMTPSAPFGIIVPRPNETAENSKGVTMKNIATQANENKANQPNGVKSLGAIVASVVNKIKTGRAVNE